MTKALKYKISWIMMAVLYFLAGLNHLVNPRFYLKIMPPWLPSHKELVFISGVCEMFFALLLIHPASRKTGLIMIIILLLAVFPANIQMSINYYRTNHPGFWLTILRLPLQVVLIWWAWLVLKFNE